MNEINNRFGLRCWPLWLVIAAFLAVLVYINPLRETAIEDDWSYALTVRNLIETGSFHLHDWAAANIPFQAYWGALFVKLFGYSFTSLRISTLVLALFGLLAFYNLSAEHGLNCTAAGLITLVLFSCPFFLLFAFSFMTEVPFLACVIMSLFLYTRAIRLNNFLLMFLASVSACASILIRQFGIAIPAALFVLWLLEAERTRRVGFYFLGIVLPAVTAILVLAYGVLAPNWTADLRMHQQTEFLTHGTTLLPFEMLWRFTVILQYLALFSVPLLLPVLLVYRKKTGINMVLPFLVFAILMIAGIFYGRYVEGQSWIMPYLPWYLDTLSRGRLMPFVVTPITTLGAILIGSVFFLRYARYPGWRNIQPQLLLIDLTTLLFLLLHFFYVQFYDRYLLVFLPLSLIVVAEFSVDWLTHHRVFVVLICLVFLSGSAMWARGWISHENAMWKGGEVLLREKISPTEVFNSWTWNCYFTFQNYLEEIQHSKKPSLDDFFYRWLPEKRKKARYIVTDTPLPRNHWKEIANIPYRNSFLRVERMMVMEKIRDRADK